MKPDVPWVADAARDTGGEGRESLFDAFRAALDEFGCRWVMISGNWEDRFRSAVAAIDRATGNRQPATDL
jgi:nicotinamide riboside kinase